MNLEQFRAIKESYNEDTMNHNIHELSADLVLRASKEASKRSAVLSALGGDVPKAVKKAKKFRRQAERFYDYQAKKRRENVTKEDLDIYDIILSHLLDEGYAETIEDAEVMMVNMSEEWREHILEMDDFAAGGGNAKMRKTGMSKDQVVALGKKNLANVAKKPTPQQPQKSSPQPKVAHGQLISKPGQPKRYADSGTVTAKHKFHTYNQSTARAQDVASWMGASKDDPRIKKWADTNYRQNIAMDTDDPKYDPTKTSYPKFEAPKRSARQSWDKL